MSNTRLVLATERRLKAANALHYFLANHLSKNLCEHAHRLIFELEKAGFEVREADRLPEELGKLTKYTLALREGAQDSKTAEAFGEFALNLIETGLKHDPVFFRPYTANFARLTEECLIPLPSEDEVRAEVERRLMGEPV